MRIKSINGEIIKDENEVPHISLSKNILIEYLVSSAKKINLEPP